MSSENTPQKSSNTRSLELREFLDSGLLQEKQWELEEQLRESPNDIDGLEKLGEVFRRQGQRKKAGQIFKILAKHHPHNLRYARLSALLLSRGLPPLAPIPPRYLVLEDFLPKKRLEDMREALRQQRDHFVPTRIRTRSQGEKWDQSSRQSSHCANTASVREWFDPWLNTCFSEFLHLLQEEPFELGLYSCKFNAYHDGDFFRLHQDRGTGVASTRRLGFIYYFNFPPQRFRGGELLIYDRDADTLRPAASFTCVHPVNNSMVIIPANVWHEVLPVVCETDDWYAARFTYTGWFHDEDLIERVKITDPSPGQASLESQ